jgi:hypothetical protein
VSVTEAIESRGVLFMKYKELIKATMQHRSTTRNVARGISTGRIGLNASAIRVKPAAHRYRRVAIACTKTTTAPAHTTNASARVAVCIGNVHNMGSRATSANAETYFIILVIIGNLKFEPERKELVGTDFFARVRLREEDFRGADLAQRI